VRPWLAGRSGRAIVANAAGHRTGRPVQSEGGVVDAGRIHLLVEGGLDQRVHRNAGRVADGIGAADVRGDISASVCADGEGGGSISAPGG